MEQDECALKKIKTPRQEIYHRQQRAPLSLLYSLMLFQACHKLRVAGEIILNVLVLVRKQQGQIYTQTLEKIVEV